MKPLEEATEWRKPLINRRYVPFSLIITIRLIQSQELINV